MKIYSKLFLFLFCLFASLFLTKPALANIDLTVKSISVNPSSPAKNEPCTITVTIYNNGDETLDSTNGISANDIHYNFRDFEITKSTYPSPPLDAGKTATYKFEGSFSDVGYTLISFNVNYSNTLIEGKTSNNYDYLELTVVEPYDYALAAITVEPAHPGIGEDCLITIDAKNNGFISFKTAQDIGSVSYDFSDFKVEETILPEANYDENKIETNDHYYYKYKGYFTETGEKTISFTLDPSDTREEKSEDNNSLNKTITVEPLSGRDLSIYEIEYDIEKPIINEEVEIVLRLKNTGNVSLVSKEGLLKETDTATFPPISKDFIYDLDDIELISFTQDDFPTPEEALDPGEYYEYTFVGKFRVAGDKNFTFDTNSNHRLSEKDYTNNATSTSLHIYKDEENRDKFDILGYTVEFQNSETAVVSWDTSKESTGNVWYQKKGFSTYTFEKFSDSEKTSHQLTLSDLDPGTKYLLKIYAENGTEERELDAGYFTTPSSNEVAFTLAPDASVNSSDQSVIFTWATNLLTKGEVKYKLKTNDNYKTGYLGEGYKILNSFKLTNLAAGEYEYYVVINSNINTSAESAKKTFTIAGATTQTNTETEPQPETTTPPNTSKTTPSPIISEKSSEPITVSNQSLYKNLKGKIILTVEANGEAYYLSPQNQEMYYLGRPDDAFSVMRGQGIGITTANLEKIPIGLTEITGPDTDGDGLSDLLEDALGTNKTKADTDGDGYSDKDELTGNHDPRNANGAKYQTDSSFSQNQAGKIFLQVEGNGEAWYINPADNKRYFLGRPGDAFAVMRNLCLGISNSNFDSL